MALKLALLSFEFESIEGLRYEAYLDHDFSVSDPQPNDSIQPVIKKAFKQIKRCMTVSVSANFHFGQTCLRNVDNYLNIGTTVFGTEVLHSDNSRGRNHTILTVKFYRLEPEIRYKVNVDIEEMPSTLVTHQDPQAYTYGQLTNENVQAFARQLNSSFSLADQIEVMPIIKRGRIDYPRYLISSDMRILEYDFDNILFEQQSEYQNVKIVKSPSLGNTLLLDNLQNLAEVDDKYTYALMDKGYVDYNDKEILILGGGDGGLLWELLKENPKFVTMVEIDSVVIEACKLHMKPFGQVLEKLEGDNYKIIVDDCMKLLRQNIADNKKYDVIFNDLTDIPICKREESLTAFEPARAKQKDNPWHFIETIFNMSLECLKHDGSYMTHTTGIGNRESIEAFENLIDNLKVKVKYESRSACVPSFMEIWLFYTLKKDIETKITSSKR